MVKSPNDGLLENLDEAREGMTRCQASKLLLGSHGCVKSNKRSSSGDDTIGHYLTEWKNALLTFAFAVSSTLHHMQVPKLDLKIRKSICMPYELEWSEFRGF